MRRVVKNWCAFLAAVGCTTALYAVSVQTQSIPGGWVWRLAQSSSSPNIMYTAAYTVHRSTDYGRTWISKPFYTELTTDGEGRQIVPYMNCTRLAVKPDDADTVIAGDISGYSGSGLFRTTNGGTTWSAVPLPGMTGYFGINVVAASLSDPDNFFVVSVPPGNDTGTGGSPITKLFKSADAGVTWAEIFQELNTNDFTINDVLQLPDGTIVAAAAAGPFRDNLPTVPAAGTIFRLDGTTGVQISSSPVAWVPVRIAWDSTNNRLWATTEAGSAANAYYSADGGLTWTKYTSSSLSVFNGDCVPVPVSFFNVAGSTPTLYIGSDTGTGPVMYRSTAAADNTGAMTEIPLPAQDNIAHHMVLHGKVHDILVDAGDPTGRTWLVATTEALYRTENDGADFVLAGGISNRDTRFGIEDAATGRMYALVFDNNLFYSGDYGTTWKKVFPPQDGIQSLMEYVTFHPTDTAKVFVHGDRNIYVTRDNGDDNFNYSSPIVNFGNGTGVTGGAAGVDNAGEIKQVVNIIINPLNPDVMYTGLATLTNGASSGRYLYKSTDGGVSWSRVSSLFSTGIHKLAFDPADPDTLFVCVGSNYGHNPNSGIALYKSTDAAQSWTKLCDFTDATGCMQTLVIDPDDSNNMWAGFFDTSNSRVYKSVDGGLNWVPMQGPNGTMNGSKIYYYKPTLYYANGGQIYKSDDRGATWAYIMGLPSMVNWLFAGMSSTTTANVPRRAAARAPSTSMIFAASASGLYAIDSAAAPDNNGGTTDTPFTGTAVKTYAFPNPYNPKAGGYATIKFTLPQGAVKATIRIYSLSGELVDETAVENIAAGTALNYNWAGRNKNGALCAPGLYFIVADTGSTKVRNKIVVAY